VISVYRQAALLQQPSLLDRDVERYFECPEELVLAHIAQDLRGHSGKIKH
jgi:hypothetical protein